MMTSKYIATTLFRTAIELRVQNWGVVSFTDKSVLVAHEDIGGVDASILELPARWLAHNSMQIRHETGQRVETIAQFLHKSEAVSAAKITAARVDGDKKGIEITFDNDSVEIVSFEHLSKYAARPPMSPAPCRVVSAADTLPRLNAEPSCVVTSPGMLSGAGNIQRVPFRSLTTATLATDAAAQYDKDLAMFGLYRDGIIVVDGCPDDSESVLRLADYFGAPAGAMHTLYGRSFLVQRRPPAGPTNNIAYTGEFLDLHNDLVYYQSMPGLQLLHCREFHRTVEGGESFFADAFAAANRLRDEYPAAFATLSTVPSAWMKDDMHREVPAMYYYAAPTIQTCPLSGQVTCVRWAPAFEAPMALGGYGDAIPAEPGQMNQKCSRFGTKTVTAKAVRLNSRNDVDMINEFFEAYGLFAKTLQTIRAEQALHFRLKPGETVVWNQARLLHGREAFVEAEPGLRKLHGCYVHIDDFRSRCMSRMTLSVPDGIAVPNWSFMNGSSR